MVVVAKVKSARRPVLSSVNYYCRFALVLAWGLFVSLSFTPIAVLFWGNTTLSWAFARVLSWGGLRILGIRIELTGKENLPASPAIYLGNHQSNFDILIMGHVYPRHTVVIGKKELRRVPVFGTFFAATGNIMIERGDRSQSIAGLDKAVDALRMRNKNIWVFPEGTRGEGRGLGKFKKGAFHMAVAAGVPLVPIVASPLAEVIDVRNRRIHGGKVRLRILSPIATTGMAESNVEQLRDQAEALFRRELESLVSL